MLFDHLINKIYIHFKYSEGIEEKEALNRTGKYYESLVYPAIEKTLEKYKTIDLRLEKLEINLDKIKIDDISESLTKLLEEEILKNINIPSLNNLEVNKNKIPLLMDKYEVFIHYLKYAQIPWYYSEINTDINQILIEISQENTINEEFIKKLVVLLFQQENTFVRFYYLVKENEPFLNRIIAYLFEEMLQLNNLFHQIIELSKQKIQFKTKRILFLMVLLKSLKNIISHGDYSENKIIDLLLIEIISNTHSVDIQKEVIKKAGSIKEINKKIDFIVNTYLFYSKKNETNRLVIDKNNQTDFNKVKSNYQNQSLLMNEAEERIRIENAGLVLFNPFLSGFFKSLHFLDETGQFKSETLRIRAVHLLQFFTGSKKSHQEHDLMLNKIICGVPLFMPINPSFRIKKQEKEEINELLKAVLTHWNVLKSSSVKGLQESFIQRKGTMEKSGNDWIVRVENTGIDVLLDDLPWSIHILKFSWNPYIIHVEWKH